MNYANAFLLRSFGCALGLTVSLTAFAQLQPAPATATLDLPDAPGYSSSDTAAAVPQQTVVNQPSGMSSPAPASTTTPAEPLRTQTTSRYDKYIDTSEIAPSLGPRDKVILGIRATVTPFEFLSIVSSAGYEHVMNSSPNYGTNSGAFAARVGASGARDTSELIFSDSVLAPLLHEDPRYYQLGEQHGVIGRTTYAISRVFITRNDEGNPTPNLSLLVGYAGAIALTNAYYPANNRNFTQTAEDYGGSLGGAAFAFVVREFLDQALHDMHMRKKD